MCYTKSMDNNLHYYFGYGMNTNPQQMDERLGASSRPRAMGAAQLVHWQFRFALYADVVPAADHQVGGVLWQITDEHLAQLDIREGYPYYYNRQLMPIEHQGQVYSAWVYFMTPGEQDRPPSQSYWDMLEQGYEHFGVSKAQMYHALTQSHQSSLTGYPETSKIST